MNDLVLYFIAAVAGVLMLGVGLFYNPTARKQ